MYNRILKPSSNAQQSMFLFGPRGTGKTSWIKANFKNALYFDLLDFYNYQMFVAHPNRLEQMIPEKYSSWIIIDEVQKIPELLNEVHRLIESKHYKFLLTGSSARSLRRRGVNLLAGRALTYYMHPFIIQELGDAFQLTKALRYGLLPGVYLSENSEKYLASYIQTYLREEVLQEGLARNIGNFSRFLEIASFSQGAVLNYSEIARESGISRQAVVNYFTILEDLLIATHLEPFTKKAKRRIIQHQKFFFFDVGVFRFLRPKGPLDITEEIDGPALETLFFQSVTAINDYYELGFKIYYWRTSDGTEVDFILYGEKGLFAFEIKRAATITSKMLNGLKSFAKDYPIAKLYLIFGGKQREYHGNITALSILDALNNLPSLLSGSTK